MTRCWHFSKPRARDWHDEEYAAGTWENHDRAVRRYWDFCIRHDLDPFAPNPTAIAACLHEYAEHKPHHGVVINMRNGIRIWFVAAGYGDPTTDLAIDWPEARTTLVFTRPHRTLTKLRRYVRHLDDTPLGRRDRAILGLYYCGIVLPPAFALLGPHDARVTKTGVLLRLRSPGVHVLHVKFRNAEPDPARWFADWLHEIGEGAPPLVGRGRRGGLVPLRSIGVAQALIYTANLRSGMQPERESGWKLRAQLTEPAY